MPNHNIYRDTIQSQAAGKPIKRKVGRSERAVALGPVELMNLLEWELRTRPRALRHTRKKYRDFCRCLYRRLQRGRS
jgi:hypothetical protein